ncbi:MAG: adenosine kinase [Deltaproteobacteria bacterium]|nr:adenosine kinase [Deltaproteobacteria bacterium]
MDILIKEDDAFLERAGVEKGGMILVEREYIDRLLSEAGNEPVIVPGGSACNAAIGIGMLGRKSRFVGKRGEDLMGETFEKDLIRHHVDPLLYKSAAPTGRVLSVITPDAQRTMFTHLGAAAEMLPEEITNICCGVSSIFHIEGYLLFNHDLMMAVLEAASAMGAKISLDLASFNVVEESRDFLHGVVMDYTDILLANEDEARAFTGEGDEQNAIDALSTYADIAVLKLGARGSLIAFDDDIIPIAPEGDGHAVDTTGAGDLWAAGFLSGLVKGFDLEKCGAIGSACGYEVCQVIGAKIPDDRWEKIRTKFEIE